VRSVAKKVGLSSVSRALIPILTATKTRKLSETESGCPAPIGFVCFMLSWRQYRFQGRAAASPWPCLWPHVHFDLRLYLCLCLFLCSVPLPQPKPEHYHK
jgi:hypothetical protein